MSKESVFVPLGLKNISDVSELSKFRKENEFPYSGLWLFTGAQGHGKTLLLMHILKEMHQDYPDALIVSNISVYGIPSVPYKGLDDFNSYHNGDKGIIFIIDEIQTLFTALVNEKMPPEMIQVWSQNRKNRRVILGTSQRFTRVAKPLREQTKLLYVCYNNLLWFRRYACFDATLFNDDGEYVGPAERKHYYVPSFDVMTKYNTLEVVKKNSSFNYSPSGSIKRTIEDYLRSLDNDSNF